MKFFQRQILLSLALLCGLILLLLHSRTPESTEQPQSVRDRRPSPLLNRTNLLAPPPAPGAGQSLLQPGRQPPGPRETAEDILTAAPIVYLQRSGSSRDCPHVLRPDNVVRETQTFQKVDNQTGLYVFSAFLDVRERVVRVVGLNSWRAQPVFCLLWYHGGQPELRVVSDIVQNLPEHHNKRYSGAYINCRLPDSRQPYAVSVTSADCRTENGVIEGDAVRPSNVLLVQIPKRLEHNFTVCVTALNYMYSRAHELVEMIELNRLLGADQFTFYVHSMGSNVAQVLRWYQRQGLVQLVSWELPVRVDHWPPDKQRPPEVHYFAQLASHNDCLNRNRGRSRYLVYQDLDEFIIPKKHLTWEAMLRDVNRNTSAYLFRCVFFRKDWPQNQENFTGRALADKFRSIVLSTDKREPRVFPHSQRAKYIIDPHRIQTVGIHNIWKYRGGTSQTNMLEQDGLLHHYRSWENPGDKHRAVRDTDIYRFKDRLLTRLQEVWNMLPDVPLDIPISEYGQV